MATELNRATFAEWPTSATTRETPYALLIEQGDWYARVWDLDGGEIRPSVSRGEYELATSAPEDVIEAVEVSASCGTYSVERLTDA